MPAQGRTKTDRAEARRKAAAVWEEVTAELKNLNAVLAAGGTFADAGLGTTVFRLPPPPPEYGPESVKAVRESVGASQEVFADLLGATAAAVRAWERGTKPPPPMARRLLAEVEADPARWRVRFVTPGKPSAREGS